MATEADVFVASGEPVEAGGQAWTLAHAGPKVRGAFSAWLKGRARKELNDQRREGILDENGYRESLTIMNEQMTAEAYNWGSPLDPNGMGTAVVAALNQTAGKVRLVQLLLEPRHGPVSAEQVLEILRGGELVGDAISRCLDPVPNGEAPQEPGRVTAGTKTNGAGV